MLHMQRRQAVCSRHCQWLRNRGPETLNEKWVAALVTGHVPLAFSDNKFLSRFFESSPIMWKPPSRYVISKGIIPTMVEKAKAFRSDMLANAEAITVIIDGSTDTSGAGIVNVIFATPMPVFMQSVESKDSSATGEYYGRLFLTAMESYSEDRLPSQHMLQGQGSSQIDSRFVAVSSDNENTMVNAKKIVRDRYNHIFSIGCTAHLINLIAKDLGKLPTFSGPVNSTVRIMKEIKLSKTKHGRWDKEWEKHAEEKGIPVRKRSLALPVSVRWYSYRDHVKRFVEAKQVLRRMEADDVLESSSDSRKIRDDRFWQNLERVRKYPAPASYDAMAGYIYTF